MIPNHPWHPGAPSGTNGPPWATTGHRGPPLAPPDALACRPRSGANGHHWWPMVACGGPLTPNHPWHPGAPSGTSGPPWATTGHRGPPLAPPDAYACRSPVVIKDPHAQDIAAQGGPRRPCLRGQSDHLSSILGSLSAQNRSTRNAREDRRHWSPLVAPGCQWLPMIAHLIFGVSKQREAGSGGGSPWERKAGVRGRQPLE